MERFAAAKSNFALLVGLINYNIVPNLAALPVNSLTPELVRQFMRDVMETPPRRGNRPAERPLNGKNRPGTSCIRLSNRAERGGAAPWQPSTGKAVRADEPRSCAALAA